MVVRNLLIFLATVIPLISGGATTSLADIDKGATETDNSSVDSHNEQEDLFDPNQDDNKNFSGKRWKVKLGRQTDDAGQEESSVKLKRILGENGQWILQGKIKYQDGRATPYDSLNPFLPEHLERYDNPTIADKVELKLTYVARDTEFKGSVKSSPDPELIREKAKAKFVIEHEFDWGLRLTVEVETPVELLLPEYEIKARQRFAIPLFGKQWPVQLMARVKRDDERQWIPSFESTLLLNKEYNVQLKASIDDIGTQEGRTYTLGLQINWQSVSKEWAHAAVVAENRHRKREWQKRLQKREDIEKRVEVALRF